MLVKKYLRELCWMKKKDIIWTNIFDDNDVKVIKFFM